MIDMSRSGGVDADYSGPICRGNKCLELDFLGEPITFNFKGSKTYDSVIGSCCSLLVIGVFVLYLTYGFLSIQHFTNQITTTNQVFNQN